MSRILHTTLLGIGILAIGITLCRLTGWQWPDNFVAYVFGMVVMHRHPMAAPAQDQAA